MSAARGCILTLMSRSKDAWHHPLLSMHEAWHLFEDADGGLVTNTNNAPRTPEQLVAELRTNIGKLIDEGDERRRLEVESELLDKQRHPTAPHPEESWRERSDKVWRGMRTHLHLENAPWHHREIWVWVASTSRGRDWVESEILYWEQRIAVRTSMVERRRETRKRTALSGVAPVDHDEIYFDK